MSSDIEQKIFIKVLGVKVDDIHNWSRPQMRCPDPCEVVRTDQNSMVTGARCPDPCEVVRTDQNSMVTGAAKPGLSSEGLVGQRTQKGYLVCVNDELIALFKVQGKLYAVKDSCPHSGGPLCMGDIEELPGEGVCVRCPWHQWAILLDTGRIGEHKGRRQSAVVYPVKVSDEGDIYIGFDQVSQNFFNIDKHPDGDDGW